jgi:hypothetical protein
MAISKIILNGVTQMDLTGDTVAASNLIAPNTAHGADGEAVVGTATAGGGGIDAPTFTSTWDDNWDSRLSISCNKTFAECYELYSNGDWLAIGIDKTQSGTEEYRNSLSLTSGGGSSLTYTNYDLNGARYDFVYNSNGIITSVNPSRFSEVLNVTTNGTYYPNGKTFSEVNVNVSGSGGSSWTKVAETSYQVSTTGTSASTVATWATGHSELWTTDKWVYIRIRDTAGKRAGYFYGTDAFCINVNLAGGSTTQPYSNGILTNVWNYTTSGTYGYTYGYGIIGYGVFVDGIYADGRLRVRKRYNKTYSLTIDGTYKVEVYLLDSAGGVPIFN